MLSGKSERLKSETSDWKTPKSERPTWISSPAVLFTPAESESSATISPTPSETPAVVSAVRAGLRSRFRQTKETQVTKPDIATSDERHAAEPRRGPARPRLGRRSCYHVGGNGGRTSELEHAHLPHDAGVRALARSLGPLRRAQASVTVPAPGR